MTTAVEPQEHTIEARGLRFHYVEWGQPEAPSIVLLHGLSSTCRIWDPFALAFQDRYRLLALDQRGHGDTSWPDEPAYSTDDYIGDLEALLEAWGIERCALVGLSMGGFNAMAFAARYPERASRLVVVDIRPAVKPEKRPTRPLDKHIAEHGHPVFASPDDPLRLIQTNNSTTPEEALRHRLRYLLKQLPDGRWVEKTDPRAPYYWQPGNLWAELPRIEAPTLIVRGGQSVVLPDEVAEQMRAAFPNAELATIAEAGHTVPEDRPEEFIAAVEAFLGRYP